MEWTRCTSMGAALIQTFPVPVHPVCMATATIPLCSPALSALGSVQQAAFVRWALSRRACAVRASSALALTLQADSAPQLPCRVQRGLTQMLPIYRARVSASCALWGTRAALEVQRRLFAPWAVMLQMRAPQHASSAHLDPIRMPEVPPNARPAIVGTIARRVPQNHCRVQGAHTQMHHCRL